MTQNMGKNNKKKNNKITQQAELSIWIKKKTTQNFLECKKEGCQSGKIMRS